MAGPRQFPDTIFDVPIFNQFPTGVPTAGASGGRLMSSMPHVDGVIVFGPDRVMTSPSGAQTGEPATRVSKDLWGFVASVAANTNFYAANISANMYRTGEAYNFGLIEASSGVKVSPAPPAKGLSVVSIFAGYNVGTLALTTATLRLGKNVFANAVAPVQTDIVAATGVATAVSTNAFTLASVAVPGNPDTQAFITDPFNEWFVELNTVQQATSTLTVYFLGVAVNFNLN